MFRELLSLDSRDALRAQSHKLARSINQLQDPKLDGANLPTKATTISTSDFLASINQNIADGLETYGGSKEMQKAIFKSAKKTLLNTRYMLAKKGGNPALINYGIKLATQMYFQMLTLTRSESLATEVISEFFSIDNIEKIFTNETNLNAAIAKLTIAAHVYIQTVDSIINEQFAKPDNKPKIVLKPENYKDINWIVAKVKNAVTYTAIVDRIPEDNERLLDKIKLRAMGFDRYYDPNEFVEDNYDASRLFIVDKTTATNAKRAARAVTELTLESYGSFDDKQLNLAVKIVGFNLVAAIHIALLQSGFTESQAKDFANESSQNYLNKINGIDFKFTSSLPDKITQMKVKKHDEWTKEVTRLRYLYNILQLHEVEIIKKKFLDEMKKEGITRNLEPEFNRFIELIALESGKPEKAFEFLENLPKKQVYIQHKLKALKPEIAKYIPINDLKPNNAEEKMVEDLEKSVEAYWIMNQQKLIFLRGVVKAVLNETANKAVMFGTQPTCNSSTKIINFLAQQQEYAKEQQADEIIELCIIVYETAYGGKYNLEFICDEATRRIAKFYLNGNSKTQALAQLDNTINQIVNDEATKLAKKSIQDNFVPDMEKSAPKEFSKLIKVWKDQYNISANLKPVSGSSFNGELYIASASSVLEASRTPPNQINNSKPQEFIANYKKDLDANILSSHPEDVAEIEKAITDKVTAKLGDDACATKIIFDVKTELLKFYIKDTTSKLGILENIDDTIDQKISTICKDLAIEAAINHPELKDLREEATPLFVDLVNLIKIEYLNLANNGSKFALALENVIVGFIKKNQDYFNLRKTLSAMGTAIAGPGHISGKMINRSMEKVIESFICGATKEQAEIQFNALLQLEIKGFCKNIATSMTYNDPNIEPIAKQNPSVKDDLQKMYEDNYKAIFGNEGYGNEKLQNELIKNLIAQYKGTRIKLAK